MTSPGCPRPSAVSKTPFRKAQGQAKAIRRQLNASIENNGLWPDFKFLHDTLADFILLTNQQKRLNKDKFYNIYICFCIFFTVRSITEFSSPFVPKAHLHRWSAKLQKLCPPAIKFWLIPIETLPRRACMCVCATWMCNILFPHTWSSGKSSFSECMRPAIEI